jgi:FkbM family methyltransferase
MKEFIKKIASKAGYHIGKKNPYLFSYEWIKEMDIKTIIDIGANTGQYANVIAKEFPNVPIHSFEPIASVYKELQKNVKHLPNVKTYNYAMGATEGKTFINHNVNGHYTSSILETGERTKSNFPTWTDETVQEEISVITLDSFVAKENLDKNIFLKIDVQGFEDQVLIGGMHAIQDVKVIQMETAFQEMYVGEKPFEYFYSLMKSNGFELAGFFDFCYDNKNGRPLFCDTIYVKK